MSLLSDLVHLRTIELVRSSINFSMDLLKELCRAHHVEGYSRRNPLAKRAIPTRTRLVVRSKL
ncbi:BZ3500_MvSof-1268-A1-R1_Chr4-1g06773 [Microbotryum saponariae]|uniref:BZ3500_MvSof-1268-A1-R1_Chr4-1g06758 protein n=1 Tax=Microbotryum saponariae TaxID=289078 RepID=A0A2X0LMB4_9BASI|nr:BZ3500_MvSof-1268-A1-R1_Chr4-1g06758 [Microbotryum saponariae]SCZ96833.1 BZ3500_MvSof-1268-A1-R1_Chr4-1g06766 [Microbotryum saponariae]SCZ96840.1 BZ3500_MvSof-1268-A1-R1_Chr4-1g06773 [Microbotryum saponariae]SDA06423.1 BZ3501_MvSof-1269-A2-R1_Chr4-1g06468 [Microbotryum saponariae]SDA06430.1 BZ3501_MvSof-1269-A2-R1_Chr4-1g06475 [Microbotryum saponariae]